jgi:hypothetical protein
VLANDHAGSDSDLARRHRGDARWMALSYGLNQLRTDQLIRILRHLDDGGDMVCDSFNYDEDRQLWCPLAIGLGIPRLITQSAGDRPKMTDSLAKSVILDVGRRLCKSFSLNPMSGTPGRFFRTTRRSDVAAVCRLLVGERRARATQMHAQSVPPSVL